MTAPAYFEHIRAKAARRWDQLEGDPELAGPWYQLFKQVQSPRHIVSELLQNADDAGATEASVYVENGEFVFTHDGEDFTEEHFASLCRFGYSNKRALHTIGFRGIGFKSTFSLGDRVELYTPTLRIAFQKNRFTEPLWLPDGRPFEDVTAVHVRISDEHRRQEVEKNLDEWLESPFSLLFFRSIRRLVVKGREMGWRSSGPGPVENTEWMALGSDPDERFLVARSPEEPFPADALREIREERLVADEAVAEFPPARVELVLGAEGRLYVVLPTGVKANLPFACNAPFIQDPARVKIKDPETSPTNRWLLRRAGELAADVMRSWLENDSKSEESRAGAYELMPDVDREDPSLEGVCATTIEVAFDEALGDAPFLLAETGSLVAPKGCVVLPGPLRDIWPKHSGSSFFDRARRPGLSTHIATHNLRKLLGWQLLEEVGKERVVEILKTTSLPKPRTWDGLVTLWSYVAPEVSPYFDPHRLREVLHVVPVQGRDELHAPLSVVRLGEDRLLESQKDWEFLSPYLRVMNPNWQRHLAKRQREAETSGEKDSEISAALELLQRFGLHGAASVDGVIDSVAASLFADASASLEDHIRLAQIAAKLGAQLGSRFRYVTQDGRLRSPDHGLVRPSERIRELMPDQWVQTHFLHPAYETVVSSCTREEWQQWASSGRSKLIRFAPLSASRIPLWGRSSAEEEMRRREASSGPIYRYTPNNFRLNDWDFDQALWAHWAALEDEDHAVWVRVLDAILAQSPDAWRRGLDVDIEQIATTGSTARIHQGNLLPSWVLKLRELPCILDTHGVPRKPRELLLRTPVTEALLDVEPFAHAQVDSERNRSLLKLLGARDTPTSPERILAYLRAFSRSATPPAAEVDKWYRRLDQLAVGIGTAALDQLRMVFKAERLILASTGEWLASTSVFVSADEEIPDAATVRASVAELSLWHRLGVPDRPTADVAIRWLKSLPSGTALGTSEARRVRAIQSRYPARVWYECGHWLNLAGQWVPVDKVRWAVTMQSLVEWKSLFAWVKESTVDLPLPVAVVEAEPFAMVPRLATSINEHLVNADRSNVLTRPLPWLGRFTAELARVRLESDEETDRVRRLTGELRGVYLEVCDAVEVTPYLDGQPAGLPRMLDVVWADGRLLARDVPSGRLARLVPEQLGTLFDRQDVRSALSYCFDREPAAVSAYMQENFKLDPAVDGDDGSSAKNKAGDPVLMAGRVNGPPLNEAAPSNVHGEAPVPPAQGDAVDSEEDASDTTLEDSDFPRSREALPAARPRPQQGRQDRPSPIVLFALGAGFRADGPERFVHQDGRVLVRRAGELFPWELLDESGDVTRRYWAKEHCLAAEPLEVDAAMWTMLTKFAEEHALVLIGQDGAPVEYSGAALGALMEEGALKMYAATYRIELADV